MTNYDDDDEKFVIMLEYWMPALKSLSRSRVTQAFTRTAVVALVRLDTQRARIREEYFKLKHLQDNPQEVTPNQLKELLYMVKRTSSLAGVANDVASQVGYAVLYSVRPYGDDVEELSATNDRTFHESYPGNFTAAERERIEKAFDELGLDFQ